jgi:hypothetical protein
LGCSAMCRVRSIWFNHQMLDCRNIPEITQYHGRCGTDASES